MPARPGMRAPQRAKPQRPQDSTSKIIQNPPRPFTIHQLYDLLILIQKGLAHIFCAPSSDSLNASPTKSASHHANKAKKENEEEQHRDATEQWNSRQRGPTSISEHVGGHQQQYFMKFPIFQIFMEFDFRTVKYHDCNAVTSHLVMGMLHEFNF